MRQLIETQRYFPFDVEIVFKVYTVVTKLWGMPTPELIMNIYDDTVQNRLRELYYGLYPDEIISLGQHPWRDLHSISQDKLQNLDELIEMKALLETSELLDVLAVFNMFYIDNYSEAFNLPIKEVW